MQEYLLHINDISCGIITGSYHKISYEGSYDIIKIYNNGEVIFFSSSNEDIVVRRRNDNVINLYIVKDKYK